MVEDGWRKFEDYSLQREIRSLWRMGVTATLSCEWGEQRRSLFFRNGQVCFAALEHADGRLPKLLFRHEVLTLEQYESVQPNLRPDRSVGQNLIEMGIITPKELQAALRAEVYQVFLACMKAREGRFLLREGQLPKGIGKIPLVFPRDLFRALLELEDKTWLSRRFGGSLDFVPDVVVGKVFDFKVPGIPEYAGTIYRLIDGKRDFRRLSFEVDVDDFVLLKFLYAMLFLGIIRTLASDEAGEDTTRSDLGEVWSRLRDLVDEAELTKSEDNSGNMAWPLPEDALESWSHGERRIVVRGEGGGESQPLPAPVPVRPEENLVESAKKPIPADSGSRGDPAPSGGTSPLELDGEDESLRFEEAEADFFSHLIEEEGIPALDFTEEEAPTEPDIELDMEEPSFPELADEENPEPAEASQAPTFEAEPPPREAPPARRPKAVVMPEPQPWKPPVPNSSGAGKAAKGMLALVSLGVIAALGWYAYTHLVPGSPMGSRPRASQQQGAPEASKPSSGVAPRETEMREAGADAADASQAAVLEEPSSLVEARARGESSSSEADGAEAETSPSGKGLEPRDVWGWMDEGAYSNAAESWKTLLWKDSRRYTLGLFMACDPSNVRQAYQAVGRDERFFILPKTYRDRDCYWVCWGLYDSPRAAMGAVGTLPADLHESKGGVQAYPLFKLSPP